MLAVRTIAVLKFLVALAIGYKVMAGVTWFEAFSYIVDCLPRPKSVKDWTPDDWQRFWNRVDLTDR